ncbi:SacI homology domain-containing protein [Chytriomyces cf. hyalinus JEL632]|nr:SacI homology domain-containing protein [Chytriomyces cf. hyalinus JEL632]
MQVTTFGYAHPRRVVISSNSVAIECSTEAATISEGRRMAGVTMKIVAANLSRKDVQRTLSNRTIYGVLGVVEFDGDIYIALVIDRIAAGVVNRATVFRITRVAFISLTNGEWDDFDELNRTDSQFQSAINSQPQAAKAASAFLSKIREVQSSSNSNNIETDSPPHPCAHLIKLFSTGTFYYSPEADLTRSINARVSLSKTLESILDTADPTYFWNAFMMTPIAAMRALEISPEHRAALDASALLICAIQGFVGVQPVSSSSVKLAILSRLSCRNAGTRFNARGIDDEGSCSNFVETEFVVESTAGSVGGGGTGGGQGTSYLASFLMVRGSVPVFWEQTGVQVTHRLDLSRGFEATSGAFRKHFENLNKQYGSVHVINLLSNKEGSAESILVNEYVRHVNQYVSLGPVHYTHFDYHSYVKQVGPEHGASMILDFIQSDLDNWSYTLIDTSAPKLSNAPPILKQQGIFRVNCLDCLDRTNHVEFVMAKAMAEKCLVEMEQGSILGTEAFVDAFQNLWADNGDWLSKIYTGTGALKTSLTRKGKQTIAGFFDDAAKSINRFYINNFLDKRRQEAIDIVVGKLKPHRSLLVPNLMSSQVEKEVMSRHSEFSKKEDISVFVGTWNVNGCLPGQEQIEFWIQNDAAPLPNLVVLGIQELIELNAQEIVSANTEQLRVKWGEKLLDVLNNLSPKARYIPLREANLLALGLFVFCRVDCIEHVRGAEVSMCKTGFAGIAANKGGIGFSFNYQDTSMVFITAHFAAGEKNADDRNKDFHTISSELNFKRKSLNEHNMIFWLGDFNYRVNLHNSEARSIIDRGHFLELVIHDQLRICKDRGEVFDHFTEAPIHFPPTYKYDNGTSVYDTSEKARCPSWTDRVLYRGKGIHVREYDHVDSLLMSDHRPVRAIFRVEVDIIDLAAQKSIRSAISSATPVVADSDWTAIDPSANQFAFQRQESTPALIDFSEEIASPMTAWNVIDSKPVAAVGSVRPSNPSVARQWWHEPVDEVWAVDEGDATNPFYAKGLI